MSFLHVARASALLVLTVAAAPANAEWDSRRVIELAAQLEETIGLGLRAAETARQQATTIQQRTRDAAVAAMKRAHEVSGEFAVKIRGGWDREESEPFFNQLRLAMRRARKKGRDAEPDPNVVPHLDRMDALMIELSNQYARD